MSHTEARKGILHCLNMLKGDGNPDDYYDLYERS